MPRLNFHGGSCVKIGSRSGDLRSGVGGRRFVLGDLEKGIRVDSLLTLTESGAGGRAMVTTDS